MTKETKCHEQRERENAFRGFLLCRIELVIDLGTESLLTQQWHVQE